MIKVFIDQGHNPTNPNAGAEGSGLREQDLVYEIGIRLAELLNSDPEFDARLSRNSPSEILGETTAQSLRARIYSSRCTRTQARYRARAGTRDLSIRYPPPPIPSPRIF